MAVCLWRRLTGDTTAGRGSLSSITLLSLFGLLDCCLLLFISFFCICPTIACFYSPSPLYSSLENCRFMHRWRSSPNRTSPETKWQRYVHNHTQPLEKIQHILQCRVILTVSVEINFHTLPNSGSRSSSTTSPTQCSSTSSSSSSLSRTARGRTSSALAGSVCSRWDSWRVDRN